jgi:peroxiredoxin Q/BCP
MTRLAPGDPAPPFTLSDADGKQVSLADYVVERLSSTSTSGVARLHQGSLRTSVTICRPTTRLAVVGIPPDPPAKIAKLRRGVPTFPLLADPDRSVLSAYGAYGEKTMYGRKVVGVIRSTFVIDENGNILEALYNVRATGHVAKLRQELAV